MGAKILVIGLDSADAGLIEAWCQSGDLPTLKSLQNNGMRGLLRSPPSMGDDAMWASFATAVSPAQHGRYFWRALLPGQYESPLFRNEHLKRPVFWEILGLSGKRIAVIDVPKNPLAKSLNGVQLADWLVHGRDGPTTSVPESLAAEVIRRFGDDTTDISGSRDWLCSMQSLERSRRDVLVQRLLKSIECKKSLLLELLQQEEWDLFLAVFKESHCAGHQLWLRHDRGETNQDLKKVYRSLDAALGEILAQCGQETQVMVFSGLGMTDNFTAEHVLDEVLQRFEKSWRSRLQNAVLSAEMLGRAIIARSSKPGFRHHPLGYRLAYQLEHNEISGAIRLNLRGREPDGRLDPADYDRFCGDLAVQLMQLKDPLRNQALVEDVLFCRKAFKGKHQDRLPDLLVKWSRSGPINGAMSDSLGTIRMAEPAYRPGNHSEGGFYIACGPRFNAGAMRPEGDIRDIAPTVAKLMGLELPDIEGRPLN